MVWTAAPLFSLRKLLRLRLLSRQTVCRRRINPPCFISQGEGILARRRQTYTLSSPKFFFLCSKRKLRMTMKCKIQTYHPFFISNVCAYLMGKCPSFLCVKKVQQQFHAVLVFYIFEVMCKKTTTTCLTKSSSHLGADHLHSVHSSKELTHANQWRFISI